MSRSSMSFGLIGLGLFATAPTPAWAGPAVPLDVGIEPLDTPEGAIPIDPDHLPTPSFDADLRPSRLGDKILYVNFDGQQLTPCSSNSPQQNCSSIFSGTVLPFSGDAGKRAAIIQVVRSRVADFGITITDTRPQSGDYDMELVGNWENANPSFAGVAPSIDCWDQRGGEISFTLEKSGTSDGIAEIILQEVAHTWGLEHVNSKADLLYPTTEGTNKTFRDECLKIVSDTNLNPSNGYCNSMHTNFCQSGWQNSYRELLALFGESIPDTTAPSITISSPSDGETIEGGDIDLVVALQDDQSPQVIALSILLESVALPMPVENEGAFAAPAELVFPIKGLPDGTYTLTVEGVDESNNPASDAVTFTVTGNGASGDTSGGADGGSSDGGGGDDAESGASSAEGDDSGADGGETGDVDGGGDGAPAGDATDEGCACSSGPSPTRTVPLLLLAGPLLRRRRSSRRALSSRVS